MIDLKHNRILILAVTTMVMIASHRQADAASLLRLNIRQLVVSAQTSTPNGYVPGFGGIHHSGRLVASDDSNTNLAVLLAGGATNELSMVSASDPLPGFLIADISAELLFDDGEVAGGSLSITVDGPGSTTESFQADLTSQSGGIMGPFGGSYYINALVENVVFSGNTFGGVSVTDLVLNTNGTLFQFDYQPSALHTDSDTTVKLEITGTPVPTPTGVIAGGSALLFTAAWTAMRRRRRAIWHQHG